MFGIVSLAGLFTGPTLMRLAWQGIKEEGEGYEVNLRRCSIDQLQEMLELASDTHTQTTIHQAIKKNRQRT